MSTDPSDGDAPKPRSFADAAALLPSLVPFPTVTPSAPPPSERHAHDLDASNLHAPERGIAATALPPGVEPATFGTLTPHDPQSPLSFGRRAWGFALVPIAAAGLFAAWYGNRLKPVLAPLPTAERIAAAPAPVPVPGGSAEGRPVSDAAPVAELSAGTPDPETPGPVPEAVTPASEAPAKAVVTPVTYNMIVLHPRPASAKGDAANARIIARLQPRTARLETQKTADKQGRLTVYYFHEEDAAAANTLAETVRTPGARVKVRGPVRTQKPWPSGSFEVWLRGP